MISDWPLLVIRMAILTLAVAALADPLWQSAARRAEWTERQARAIVVDTTPSVTGRRERRRDVVPRERGGGSKGRRRRA